MDVVAYGNAPSAAELECAGERRALAAHEPGVLRAATASTAAAWNCKANWFQCGQVGAATAGAWRTRPQSEASGSRLEPLAAAAACAHAQETKSSQAYLCIRGLGSRLLWVIQRTARLPGHRPNASAARPSAATRHAYNAVHTHIHLSFCWALRAPGGAACSHLASE
jgi:hypothetical protein